MKSEGHIKVSVMVHHGGTEKGKAEGGRQKGKCLKCAKVS
jgi:hypothetical protein